MVENIGRGRRKYKNNTEKGKITFVNLSIYLFSETNEVCETKSFHRKTYMANMDNV